MDNLLNQQMEVEFAGVRFRSVARELLHTAFAGRANELEQLKARANGSAEELYRLAAVAAGWTIEPSLSPKAAVDKLLDQQFERESAGVRFRSVARALLQTSFAGRAEELERLKQRANGSGEELLRLAQGSSPAQ